MGEKRKRIYDQRTHFAIPGFFRATLFFLLGVRFCLSKRLQKNLLSKGLVCCVLSAIVVSGYYTSWFGVLKLLLEVSETLF